MANGVPIALTVAGSDSGGGAGIQADLKAMSALGVFGASVLTAVTAQNTTAVTAVHEIPADVVAAQLAAVLSDLDVKAVKIGMLFSPAIIDAVADGLSRFEGPVVLDPVMIAKSGDALLQDAAVASMIERLVPRADLLTPNLPEAAKLLGVEEATTVEEATEQGAALTTLGANAILMKGGHSEGADCIDVLVSTDGVQTYSAPRVATHNTHGTGCTYSASIASGLAKGLDLPRAVGAAHSYLHEAIRRSDDLSVGSGHGPVHHFHAIWSA